MKSKYKEYLKDEGGEPPSIVKGTPLDVFRLLESDTASNEMNDENLQEYIAYHMVLTKRIKRYAILMLFCSIIGGILMSYI